MKKIFNLIFKGFGWIFFIFDIKNIFLSFIIHLAVIFFLMILVFNQLGAWWCLACFGFLYLGGANILMIQKLGQAKNERIFKLIDSERETSYNEEINEPTKESSDEHEKESNQKRVPNYNDEA